MFVDHIHRCSGPITRAVLTLLVAAKHGTLLGAEGAVERVASVLHATVQTAVAPAEVVHHCFVLLRGPASHLHLCLRLYLHLVESADQRRAALQDLTAVVLVVRVVLRVSRLGHAKRQLYRQRLLLLLVLMGLHLRMLVVLRLQRAVKHRRGLLGRAVEVLLRATLAIVM